MGFLEALITPNVCESAYDWAWIWYCDECQDHGTAETSEEAHYYALCHAKWKTFVVLDEEGNVDLENNNSDAHWERVANLCLDDKVDLAHKGEVGALCGLYIVSVKMNKTFMWEYDYEKEYYENDTPHQDALLVRT